MRALLFFSIAALLPIRAETVDLIRDHYGVPHVFARTPAAAAFAIGYAQAEDRLAALLRNFDSAKSNEPADLDPPLSAIADGFAKGVNRYLAEHPELADTHPISPSDVARFARSAYSWIRGANDLMITPRRTTTGVVFAILDPLGDWESDLRPYEMRIYISEGDLAMSGIAPAGFPFPIVGYNRYLALGWNGGKQAGAGILTEAWNLITAPDLPIAQAALAMNQIPGTAYIATTTEVFDSGGSTPALGYLMRPRASRQADRAIREVLGTQTEWPFGRADELAFSYEVFGAQAWQKRIARTEPGLAFARTITGWNRRSDPGSIPALAYYLFKMELGRESPMVAPPDSLSDARLRAALDRARDQLEISLPYNSTYGSLFRIAPTGGSLSFPVGGGTVTEAGMETPRSIEFMQRGKQHAGVRGQTATQLVDLGDPASSTSVLATGESDDPKSPHFDDQARELFAKGLTKPVYFGNRRELERTARSIKTLTF